MECGNLVIRESINGYRGWLDFDYAYKDYPKIIKEKGTMGSVKMMEIPRNQRNQNHIYAIM